MANIRRWYFYTVCAISLQAVTWAAVALLRNLLLEGFNLRGIPLGDQTQIMAFQTAVIIVGLPLFLSHWRWAARSEPERDEGDHLQLLYLYFMLSAFLLPLVFNLRGLLEAVMRLLVGAPAPFGEFAVGSNWGTVATTLAAVFVLGLMALYHARLLREQRPSPASDQAPATLQQLFLLLFSAVGLIMTAQGAYVLLSQFLQPPQPGLEGRLDLQISGIAQLLTGLLVWLPAWLRAQRMARAADLQAGAFLAHMAYLYLVVLVTLITAVSSAAVLLSGLLRVWFGRPGIEGSGGALSALIVATALLVYHTLAVREAAQLAPAPAQGAALRRVFWYLLAAVGLLATLAGLGGVISVAVSALTMPGQSGLAGEALRDQLAAFLAVLVAGLPVWLVAWRQVQAELAEPSPVCEAARLAEVRRLYLYGFILLATLTFLGCAVYLVGRALSTLLGEALPPEAAGDLARAGAYAFLAVLVWLYHGRLLREDNAALAATAPLAGRPPHIVILEDGDGRFARQMAATMAEAYPDGTVTMLALGDTARAALPAPEGQADAATMLREADIIISPWTAATPFAGPPLPAAELGAAFATSKAQKVLVPFNLPGWVWAAAPPQGIDAAVAETAQAVRQILAGQPGRSRSTLSAGRLLLLLLGTFIVVGLLAILIGSVISVF